MTLQDLIDLADKEEFEYEDVEIFIYQSLESDSILHAWRATIGIAAYETPYSAEKHEFGTDVDGVAGIFIHPIN